MEKTEEKVEWLRSQYEEVPQDCPVAKRVKLSDIHHQLEEKYDTKHNHHEVASILQRAFPHSNSKVAGKSRTKHIFGIQPVVHLTEPSSDEPSIESLSEQLAQERKKNAQLHERVQCLEAKVQELKSTSPPHLITKMDTLSPRCLAVSGPDSYEHFCEFTLERMVHELQEMVPDLYSFFMKLGDVSRRIDLDGASQEHTIRGVKALSSLCTLLNARSNRVNGLQLLLSMMLIARSTNKQVISLSLKECTLNIHT